MEIDFYHENFENFAKKIEKICPFSSEITKEILALSQRNTGQPQTPSRPPAPLLFLGLAIVACKFTVKLRLGIYLLFRFRVPACRLFGV